MDYMDGNMLAGALREVFTVDVTAAQARCAGCGRTAMLAETRVYDHAAGLVARCPGCDSVLLRLIRAPDRAYLDLHGMSFLEVPLP
jgi:ribosomal protein S27E